MLKWKGDILTRPPMRAKVLANTALTGGKAEVTQTDSSLIITLPVADQARPVTVVRLDLDTPLSQEDLFDKVDDAK